MSNFIKYLVLIVCFISISLSTAYTQSLGDYRSRSAGGNWNGANTWEVYTAGSPNYWNITATAPTATAGTVTILAGTTVNANITTAVLPNLVVSGTLVTTANNIAINATTATIASGGTVTISNNTTTLNFTTYNVNGTHSGANASILNVSNLNVAGTFNPTGNVTFASNSTIAGSGTISFGNNVYISTNNVSITNQTTITIISNLDRSGTATGTAFINATAASVLNYMGGNAPMVNGTLTATAVGNTVNYNAPTAGQTIAGTTYYHLTLTADNSTKNLGGNTIVNGNLNLTGTSSAGLCSFNLGNFGLVVEGTTSIKAYSRMYDGNNTPTAANSNWFKGAVTVDVNGNIGATGSGMQSPTTFETTLTNNGTFLTTNNGFYIFKGAVVNTGTWSGNSTLTYDFQSTLNNSGSFTSGGGTFNFTGAVTNSGTATFAGANTFGNTFSTTSGATTISGVSSFASTIITSSGALLNATARVTVAGALTNSGTSTFNGVANIFNGTVSSLAGTLTISGTSTYNNNISASSGATLNASGASTIATSLNVTGAGSITFGAVTINDARVFDNQTAITITGLLNGVGGAGSTSEFRNSLAASVLNYSYGVNTGPMVMGLLTASVPGNTVNYIAVGSNQNLKATTYHHVNIGGLNTNISKYLTGATIVNGNLTITGTNSGQQNYFRLSGYDLTVNGTTTINAFGVFDGNYAAGVYSFNGPVDVLAGGSIDILSSNTVFASAVTNAGTFRYRTVNINFENGLTNTGTFTTGTGALVFRKNPQTVTGVSTIPSLIIGQATDAITNAITIANDVVVSTNLTFVKGVITTGTNTLIISTVNAAALVAGPTSGWVNGNLRRSYSTGGNQSRSFGIGSATVYAGVDLTVSNVTTSGAVTARTDDGDASSISGSCLNAAKSVNRTWTLTANTMVPAVGSLYTLTANFVPADLDAGVNTANLIGSVYNGTAWIFTTTSATTATSATLTNFTSLGVLQLAEPGTSTAPVSPDPTVFGSNQWNVYTYNANSAINYAGYYTDGALSLITTNSFANNQTPQYASTYLGCGVSVNNFYTSAKRTGFSPDFYQIAISTTEPYALIIDGVIIRSGSNQNIPNVWTGYLSAASQVEYQWTGNALPNSSSLTITTVIPAALDPGVIAGSQRLCGGQIPQSGFTSTVAATSGCTFNAALIPANTYQWQYSADGSTWANIVGANTVTYTVSTPVNSTSYYRRAISDDCNRTAYSNVLTVEVDNGVYGDPAVFGAGVWNAYCYKNANYTNYAGYYTESNQTFTTTSRFGTTQSPSFASGYLGCQIQNTNYSVIYKREGFDPATYRIDISSLDDGGTLIVNGVTVGTWGCCVPRPAVWTGPLGPTSTVEWRWFGNGSANYCGLTFTEVTPPPLTGGTISSDQVVCAGDYPVPFTNLTLPSGGCTVSSYKWQYLTDGAADWVDIASSNTVGLTFPQSIYKETRFRRIAYDLCGYSAASLAVTVSINNTPPGDPADFGVNTWNFFMYDDQAFGNYVGYGTQTGTVGGTNRYSFRTTDYYATTAQPSTMSGYQGCQQLSTYYSVIAKRTGFDGNYYQIDIPCWDDDVYLFINGTQQVFSSYVNGCGSPLNAVWTGRLTAASTVEFRTVNYGGPGNLQVRFTDLGTTAPNALVAGTISNSPSKFCIGNMPYINSVTPASGGCSPLYQWQSSSSPNDASFTDVAGATSASFTGTVPLTSNTYFRRKASDNCGNTPVTTSAVLLEVNNTVSGNPPTPGNGEWNAYVYNSTNYTNYAGYYRDPVVNFNTATSYTTTGAPSLVSNYQGCQVGNTNYSVRFIRTNLTAGTYQIDIPAHDDGVALFIDNVQVFLNNTCCVAETNVWTGTITSSTIIEARFFNGGGPGNLNVTLTPVSPATSATGGTVIGNQTVCGGAVPTTFTESVAGSSTCYVYYQWQKSTDNLTFTNIVGATSNTFTETATLTQNTYYRRVTKDACGNTANSNTVLVAIYPALAAGTVGVDQSLCSGSTASITSTAAASGGTGTYSYQWQSSTDNTTFTDIASATSATYTSGALTTSTWFRRKVTSCSVTNSNTVAITINPATAITTNPSSATACNASSVSFNVAAVGRGLSYQWQVSIGGGPFNNVINNSTYSGVNTTTLSITNVAMPGMHGNQYRCVVTATCTPTTVTSAVATLTSGGPAITTQPINSNICIGSNTTFTVTTPNSPVTYQWQLFSGGSYANIANDATYSNVNTNTLTVSNAGVALSGNRYRAVISSAVCASVTNSVDGILNVYNVITSNTVTPASSAACSGTSLTLTGSAPSGGSSSFLYQWQSSVDNVSFSDIAGATNASLTTSITATTYFRRVVNSGGCSSTSASVVVNLNQATTITTQPSGVSVCPDEPASFSVTANGAITGYQWFVSVSNGPFTALSNDATYANVTSATLNINSATAAMNGNRYRVRITSACTGAINSSTVSLNTNGVVTILTQPVNTTSCSGVTINLGTSSTGLNLIYKWQVDNGAGYADIVSSFGGLYSNFTTATLRINTPTTAMSGYKYRLIVTSSCGAPVPSDPAIITIYPAITGNTISAPQTVCSGDTPALLNGSTPNGGGLTPPPVVYTYTWYSSNDNATFILASGTNNEKTYTPSALSSDTYFRRNVAAGNCASINSPVIKITVTPPTVINTQPADFSACQGTNTSVSIVASGGALSYQWEVSTNGGTIWTNVSGLYYQNGTTATLTVLNTPAAFNGYKYRCVVNGNCSPSYVYSNAATLAVGTAPVFTAGPPNRSVCEGSNTTFSVTATAVGPITYTWYYSVSGGPNTLISDNSIFSGSTTSTLSVSNVSPTLSGYVFKCLATFSGCSTLSTTGGSLTVSPLPKVTVQPVNPAAICQGSNLSFAISIAPASAVVQWQEYNGTSWSNVSNGGIYSGANSTNLNLTNVPTTLHNHQFRANVTATCNPNDVSAAVTVLVKSAGEWLGITSTDWNTVSNWCSGIPTSTTDVVIPASAPYKPVISATAACRNLRIDSSATLQIVTNNTLSVYGNFINNDVLIAQSGSNVVFAGNGSQLITGNKATTFYNLTVNNSGGGVTLGHNQNVAGTMTLGPGAKFTNPLGDTLTFLSTASETARLAAIPVSATFNGIITMQRYVPGIRGYRYFSSPIANAPLSQIADDMPVTGFAGGSTGSGIIATSPSMYSYDETVKGSKDVGWVRFGSSMSSTMENGKGYTLFVRRPGNGTATTFPAITVDMTGIPNKGDITISNLTLTDGSGVAGYVDALKDDGWHLIGNPYPCPISWKLLWNNNANISPTVSYRAVTGPSAYQFEYFNAVTEIGVPASATDNISINQAVWLQVIENGPQSLTFKESMKSPVNTNFMRTASHDNLLRVTMNSASLGLADEAAIYFTDGATRNQDLQYDANKFYNTNVSIATLSADTMDLALNSLPLSSLKSDTVNIAMGSNTGSYSFTFQGLESFSSATSIVLEDKHDSTLTLVTPDLDYKFSVVNADESTYDNRFRLLFNTTEVVTNIPDAQLSSSSFVVYPVPSNGKTLDYTYTGASLTNATIKIVDLYGKTVYSKNVANVGLTKLSGHLQLGQLSSGVYTVVLSTNRGDLITKLIVVD